jgi:predicted N-acetyltransferase YhbS
MIRDRRPDDGAALEAIALETHHRDGYPKYLPADLRSFIVENDALRAWVAQRDGEILGHVALHARAAPEVMEIVLSATGLDEDQVIVLARFLVAPWARRQGIGSALIERATEEAVSMGRRAVLDVVDTHHDAIALYERGGWTRAGRVDWALPGGRPLREFVYLSPLR